MSIAEMHDQFRIEYDAIDSFSNPEYSPEEIDYFLNSAQDNLLIEAKRAGVESNQTLRDMLSNITNGYQTNAFIVIQINEPNGVFVELPEDYRTALKEAVTISYTDCNGIIDNKRIKVVPSTHDRLNVDIENPFKKPNKFERVISVPYGKLINNQQVVELITDGTFSIMTYHLRYIRNPLQMDINNPTDSELNEEAQNWIIKEAAKEAFKATNQLQKYQLLKQLDR